jgi:purine-nucleoside phosphorylase
MIPTPHITAKEGEIAKLILMPGDPLRAEYIANKFLENPKLVNKTRNMFMFTGTYKGVPITIAASGMGVPSMGIYAYELLKFYDADVIIRIGTAGSTDPNIKVNDVLNINKTVGDNDFQKAITGIDSRTVKPTQEVIDQIDITAKGLGYNVKQVAARCTANFYTKDNNVLELAKKAGTSVEEMETYALFSTGVATGKKVGAIMTVSDEIITGANLTAEQRQTNVDKMAKLGLETIIKFAK